MWREVLELVDLTISSVFGLFSKSCDVTLLVVVVVVVFVPLHSGKTKFNTLFDWNLLPGL